MPSSTRFSSSATTPSVRPASHHSSFAAPADRPTPRLRVVCPCGGSICVGKVCRRFRSKCTAFLRPLTWPARDLPALSLLDLVDSAVHRRSLHAQLQAYHWRGLCREGLAKRGWQHHQPAALVRSRASGSFAVPHSGQRNASCITWEAYTGTLPGTNGLGA